MNKARLTNRESLVMQKHKRRNKVADPSKVLGLIIKCARTMLLFLNEYSTIQKIIASYYTDKLLSPPNQKLLPEGKPYLN